MKNPDKYFISLQLAVMLFGGAGLFGKLIPLDPIILVWGRTILASLFLLLMMRLSGEKFVGTVRQNLQLLLISGPLLALHWVTFFKSVMLANVSVAVLTFSTFPVFTIVLAPLFRLGRIKIKQLFFGALSLVGVAIMLPFGELWSSYGIGLFWGMMSSLSFAMLTLSNKKCAENYGAFEQAFWQNTGAALLLAPALLYGTVNLLPRQFFLWILLGTVFTGLSHGLYVFSLKGIEAQKASLYAALEPVYAIVWALLFLGEFPIWQELCGAAVILGAVWFANRK